MAAPRGTSSPTTISAPPKAHTTRLTGRLLVLARVAWAALAALLLGLYALLLPTYWTHLHTVCASAAGSACAVVQPSPASAQTLHQLGVSVAAFAASAFTVALISTLICLAVSAVIVWRKSDDWMALLVALTAVALSNLYITSVFVQLGQGPWRLPATILNVLGSTTLFTLFALFPSGRFAPAWMRWVLVAWCVCGAALIAFHTWPKAFGLYSLAWAGMAATVVGTQVYRYRRISTPGERQQTKWVVLGVVGAGTLAIGFTVPAVLVPSFGEQGAIYQLVIGPGYMLAVALLAAAIGMAVLRSRLFDIDVIIRRALIYSLLTGALALIYFGSIVGVQAIIQAAGGQRRLPPVLLVASTLLIAALFQPLRRRIQGFIDRRFYRRKYDAARTVAAFGVTLRSEVDLVQLTDDLVAVVEEALQPSQVNLWMVRRDPRARAPSP